jgi:hypothetical protein
MGVLAAEVLPGKVVTGAVPAWSRELVGGVGGNPESLPLRWMGESRGKEYPMEGTAATPLEG